MKRPVRVLYVDDDEGLGVLLRRTLGAAGYEVEHVVTGDAAIARLERGGIGAVALDHNLDGETGLDLLPRIRAIPDAPPVIYVTGSDDVRVAVAALKNGASDYVWKDVQGHYKELLAASIDSALTQEALRREKERADREIREGKERAELLLAEVNHRVANSLSIVVALARLQASATPEPAAKEALNEVQARVTAIAAIHRRLYTSTDVRFIEMDAYLESLTAELNETLTEARRPNPITLVATSNLLMPTDKAVSVGICMTELVTNARKYAYPGAMTGEIRVRFEMVGDGRARLSVEDDGVGWTGQGVSQGTGVGSRVVNAMAANMKTTLEYRQRERGTCAFLEFSVTEQGKTPEPV